MINIFFVAFLSSILLLSCSDNDATHDTKCINPTALSIVNNIKIGDTIYIVKNYLEKREISYVHIDLKNVFGGGLGPNYGEKSRYKTKIFSSFLRRPPKKSGNDNVTIGFDDMGSVVEIRCNSVISFSL